MITKQQIQEIRKELEDSVNPLFFFHDDADGLCSFLQLYRFVKEGHGIIIKTTPKIDEKFIQKVEEYHPDKIFIVDIAMVDQDFIDKAKTKIIWIDHHEPLKRHNVKYYNPRINNKDANIPVSYICHKVTEQDLWIAMAGCIGDWYMPDFADEFKEQYPDLLKKEITNQEDALFNSKLGKLIKIMEFCLKGNTSDVMKCVKILTRIKTPYEIINQETPAGKYLYKKYTQMNKGYTALLDKAMQQKPDNKLLLFHYPHDRVSFTKDLANELLHKNPDKVIIIAREKSEEIKMSLRSKNILIPPILEKVLKDIEGYGGGHEHACGANIKKKDFKKFIDNFKNSL